MQINEDGSKAVIVSGSKQIYIMNLNTKGIKFKEDYTMFEIDDSGLR